MRKLTKNIEVKVGSIKGKAGQTITGKISRISKSSNKTVVKPGQTISGNVRRRAN